MISGVGRAAVAEPGLNSVRARARRSVRVAWIRTDPAGGRQPPANPPETMAGRLAGEIFAAFRAALQRQGSELLRRPEVEADLIAQVRSVVSDVLQAHPQTRPRESLDADAFRASMEIGASRAVYGIHPTESLHATLVLFHTTLPVLVRELAPADPTAAVRISQLLHESMMSRVAVASLSYVSFLMEKLHASRQEERQRIARDLHDRILHGVALSLQSIDLHRHYAGSDPQRSALKLDNAVSTLQDAVHTMQQLAAELRRSVGDRGLEPMLRSYMQAHVDPHVRWSLTADGDVGELPTDVAEELYLILREAVRNALRHAHPGELRVEINVDGTRVEASVTDDGTGFQVDAPRTTGGISSMQERALLCHGELELDSGPGRGTRVRVRVPLSGVNL